MVYNEIHWNSIFAKDWTIIFYKIWDIRDDKELPPIMWTARLWGRYYISTLLVRRNRHFESLNKSTQILRSPVTQFLAWKKTQRGSSPPAENATPHHRRTGKLLFEDGGSAPWLWKESGDWKWWSLNSWIMTKHVTKACPVGMCEPFFWGKNLSISIERCMSRSSFQVPRGLETWRTIDPKFQMVPSEHEDFPPADLQVFLNF